MSHMLVPHTMIYYYLGSATHKSCLGYQSTIVVFIQPCLFYTGSPFSRAMESARESRKCTAPPIPVF